MEDGLLRSLGYGDFRAQGVEDAGFGGGGHWRVRWGMKGYGDGTGG